MPELPEVEIVCRGLDALLPGHYLRSVERLWPNSFECSPVSEQAGLLGFRFTRVWRRAKVIIIELESGYALVIHLKMTGQLVFIPDEGPRFGAGHPSDSLVDRLPDRSTRVCFQLDGARLYFNDQRKFGWIRLIPISDVLEMAFIRKLGPEPLEETFTAIQFEQALRKRPGSGIKAVLLDQTIVSGIGNIYADESLWAAGIHPETKVINLNRKTIKILFKEMRKVLLLSIHEGGSSDRNYVNAEGKRGSFLHFAKVFRREGKPCFRCSTIIEKIRVAGRGTHVCPACQVPVKGPGTEPLSN